MEILQENVPTYTRQYTNVYLVFPVPYPSLEELKVIIFFVMGMFFWKGEGVVNGWKGYYLPKKKFDHKISLFRFQIGIARGRGMGSSSPDGWF